MVAPTLQVPRQDGLKTFPAVSHSLNSGGHVGDYIIGVLKGYTDYGPCRVPIWATESPTSKRQGALPYFLHLAGGTSAAASGNLGRKEAQPWNDLG